MGWSRGERQKRPLGVADAGIRQEKIIPFHKAEKMDEEVCLSIHQLQLIFLLFSAIQVSPTSESQGFS